MDQTMNFTITESERVELETLLDLVHREIVSSQARHEELMAESDHLGQETRRLLADIKAQLEFPYSVNRDW